MHIALYFISRTQYMHTLRATFKNPHRQECVIL